MLNLTDKPVTEAPTDWASKFAINLYGDHLEEYGGLYANSVVELTRWLKHHQFTYNPNTDVIAGKYDGKRMQAIIWKGEPLGGGAISNAWAKS